MPQTIIKIKTWHCPACGYQQDYDGSDEDLHGLHHPGVKTNACPNCALQGKDVSLERQNDEDKLFQVTVRGEEELEHEQLPDLQDDGATMDEGDDGSKTPKMRPLHDQELEEERQKIQDSLAHHDKNRHI